jgi:hypothetical protein
LPGKKTSPRSKAGGSSTDADHAPAAILGFKNERPLVYVVKNAGLDDKDKTLFPKLEGWLRAESLTGQRRRVGKDRFWLTWTQYNRPRLEFYVSELARVERVGNYASVQNFQDKCKNYGAGPIKSDSSLTDIIADASLPSI